MRERIGGRFVVEAEAGSGGMGTVYRAHDAQTDARVAVKVLRRQRPMDLERFISEAEALARLDHPAIVRYVAHGTDAGAPWLAMSWVEGDTLSSRLRERGLTVAETLIAGRRVADALGHAHARGLVHRDLKPSNLIFAGGDLARIMVIDFGVARAAGTPPLTPAGTAIGTPGYMAPEQARGERDVDARADVFALGCVLYECLTGRPAFQGRQVLALQAKILLWDPAPVDTLAPNVPKALVELVARMLAKAPGERPADGAAVAERLAAIAPGAGEATRRRSGGEPTTWVPSTPGGPCSVTVLAVDPAEGAGGDRPLRLARLAAEAELVGAATEVNADGAVVALLDGADEAEVVGRALRLADRLRDVIPGALVAVGAGLDALDVGVDTLARASVDAAFGARAGHTVHLDARAARHLEEQRRGKG